MKSLKKPKKGYKKVKGLFGRYEEIPEEWEIDSLSSFVIIQSGEYFQYNEFVNKGVPVLKIDNVMHLNIFSKNRHL